MPPYLIFIILSILKTDYAFSVTLFKQISTNYKVFINLPYIVGSLFATHHHIAKPDKFYKAHNKIILLIQGNMPRFYRGR